MLSLCSLSDESSVIPGSLGLLPSASLAGAPDPKSTTMGLYEPYFHFSLPYIPQLTILQYPRFRS